jgi:hypothetical protein
MRAEAFAISLAENACRKGQQNLLPEDILQIQTISLIIPDFGLGRGDGIVLFEVGQARGAVEEVEVAFQRLGYGLDAAGAGQLKRALIVGADADVGDDLVGAMMLLDQVGATIDGQRAGGDDFVAVGDGCGAVDLGKFDGILEQVLKKKAHV